jgi:hypothetical protein
VDERVELEMWRAKKASVVTRNTLKIGVEVLRRKSFLLSRKKWHGICLDHCASKL